MDSALIEEIFVGCSDYLLGQVVEGGGGSGERVHFSAPEDSGQASWKKLYERALLSELTLRSVKARTQVPFAVWYKGECIGEYLADLLIEDQPIVELKCVESGE